MKLIFLIIFVALVVAAIVLQWQDCVKGYGNTMGGISLYNSFWILATIFFTIYFIFYIGIFFSILVGIAFFISHYGVVFIIEKIGLRYK